jgi:cytolethal distending toxin subunit B
MALLVTWNMQGATGFGRGNKWRQDVTRLFLQEGAQIACLQECGALPATAVVAPALAPIAPGAPVALTPFVWNMGTTRRPLHVAGIFAQTDPAPPNGANRNNLAIVTTLAPQGFSMVAGPVWGRPALGVTFNNPNGGTIAVYCLHARSGGGNDAPTLLGNIAGTGGSWFAAGDYNRNPASWAGVIPMGAVICAHQDPTLPAWGTILDYAFCTGAAIPGEVEENFVVSDHFPVYYDNVPAV